ncbi:hypothetical protein STTU_4848 [Streptomyces sp. Tu6071]|nr:hypothetical protein STTU_4848 [Streptomyces sp. Tu6071]
MKCTVLRESCRALAESGHGTLPPTGRSAAVRDFRPYRAGALVAGYGDARGAVRGRSWRRARAASPVRTGPGRPGGRGGPARTGPKRSGHPRPVPPTRS